MNLKKAAACAAISALLLTGCAGGQDNVTENTVTENAVQETVPSDVQVKQPSPADITAAITAEIEIPSAVEKDKDSIDFYFTVDKAQLESVSMFICGSGAFPDELVVLKMTSDDAAVAAAGEVQKHLDSQIELYRDYTPDEFYKLEGAAVTVKNGYVMLFVCADNARAMEIAESLF